MKQEKSKAGKIIKSIIVGLFALIIILSAVILGMCLGNSRPAVKTTEEYAEYYPDVLISVDEDGSVELSLNDDSEQIRTGIVFYCGAQIEPSAYIPIMAEIAEKGYFVVIPKLTFNMAAISHNIAGDIIEEHEEIDNWYIGGHSIGGLTASGFAADNLDKINGLILLAAYTNRDLSDTDLPIISIYGDCDTVMNKNLYTKRLSMNSTDFEEYIINGANHAGFGDYGEQPRDSAAEISQETQWFNAANLILYWLEAHSK